MRKLKRVESCLPAAALNGLHSMHLSQKHKISRVPLKYIKLINGDISREVALGRQAVRGMAIDKLNCYEPRCVTLKIVIEIT